MLNAEFAFRQALQSVYGPLDWLPIPDGDLHRFHVPGDRTSTRNGWYVLHPDGIASAAFGSWKAGDSHTWSSRHPVDHREAEQVRQRIQQARQQREAEQHQRQQAAAEYARRIHAGAGLAYTDHPYLIAKGIAGHGLRQAGDTLLVPLIRDGVLVNLQRIRPDGDKRFLFGGVVKGCCALIGVITPGQPLYITEGWATGATIHEETGAAVACAMNAGNLLEVGRRLKRQHPDTPLIFAGDDDRQTEAEGKGNPGRKAANAVAAVVGGLVAFPDFPADAPINLSDFNDLRTWIASHAQD